MKVDLRKYVKESDFAHLSKCIGEDVHHPDLKPEEWDEELTETFVFADEQGNKMHVRLSRAVRIDVQFDPEVAPENNKVLLQQSFAWLKGRARAAGFREAIFESSFAPLINFCCKHFAFKQSPNELKSYL